MKTAPTLFLQKIIAIVLLVLIQIVGICQTKTISLASLTQGQKVNGFVAQAIYTNDANEPMGGRFVHERTRFILDLLQIESVPQSYIWVQTFPVSDKGEPHTQEHLLITKGNKGHELNTIEGMSIAASNAFTDQLHTAYHFYTGAGAEPYYNIFEKYLDALLHPDYTDEEVKREVRNWGVTENPGDKSLRLEEKGSVYNEMTTSMTNPFSLLYAAALHDLYGNSHPLSYNAGGTPAAIREIQPGDIKQFHDANYHLGNMGAITSVPKEMTIASVLSRVDHILNKLEPNPGNQKFKNENDLPAPQPAETGKIDIVDYPSKNDKEAGAMLFPYPANLKLDVTETLLLQNFLAVFSGDASTNLYKKFVDSKTRVIDIGATSVFGYLFQHQGDPVIFGVNGVSVSNLTKEKATQVRQIIMDELNRVASFTDNSAELKEFNNRFKNQLVDTRRHIAKGINTPPQFGFRNTGTDWYDNLNQMASIHSFRKSIIYKPQFDDIDKMLATGKNFWKTFLTKLKLTEEIPYVVVSKANPTLIDTDEKERKSRANAEITRLEAKYNVTDEQESIKRYKAEYDANSKELERLEQSHASRFIDNPPLTLDDQLNYSQRILPGNIKIVSSTFNNMTSAKVGLAIRLDAIPDNEMVYLSMLPSLLTQTGVIKDGKPISYDEMSQMLQQQILSLNAEFSTNLWVGRSELLLTGAGNNISESQRAVDWMNLVLQHPNWRIENIARIRDVVDQELDGLRHTMQGREESWVTDPGNAYAAQNDPLYLSVASFLTRAHNIYRLKWMLKDAGDAENRMAIDVFFASITDVTASRDELKTFLTAMQGNKPAPGSLPVTLKGFLDNFEKLPVTAKALAVDAAKDLEQILNDIPDESLAGDWKYLCSQMRKDLSQTPSTTLKNLDRIRLQLLSKSNARMYLIGSSATQQKLSGKINTLLSGLKSSVSLRVNHPGDRIIEQRVQNRLKTFANLVYVGLMNPNNKTGVFMNSAPLTNLKQTDMESLYRYLAGLLYAGAGKQSVYTKTTGAGLSYSTGIGASISAGRINYYAERTPELPQTLRFVIDEIKHSQKDTSMREYVIALALGRVRAASDYETRGAAMASDLTDGYTPEKIRKFRKAILALRNSPGLIDEIYKRKDEVYEQILPGYGIKEAEVKEGIYFVIGNEKQMTAYEAYLKSVDGPKTKLYRLYPRDFWVVEKNQ